jgi:hypothetical protein
VDVVFFKCFCGVGAVLSDDVITEDGGGGLVWKSDKDSFDACANVVIGFVLITTYEGFKVDVVFVELAERVADIGYVVSKRAACGWSDELSETFCCSSKAAVSVMQ